MQVAHVPHAGAFEQPVTLLGDVAPVLDFSESELELQASAATSESAANPMMPCFM